VKAGDYLVLAVIVIVGGLIAWSPDVSAPQGLDLANDHPVMLEYGE
jgi:hypothetical protein